LNMERISVAMAAYNGAEFLSDQIDSILCQLEPQDELVVSYDISNDGTWELLTRYQALDSRVKVYKNQHPGIAENFDNALRHCDGDYIFISDQDDKWTSDKRVRVVRAFKETGADMVIHNGIHTNSELKPISEPFFTTFRIGDGKIRNLIKSRYSGCCMAFTPQMRDRVVPIPPKVDAYDRWIGTIGEFMGKITYVNDVLLFHRLHKDNATPTNPRSFVTIHNARLNLLKHLYLRLKRERNARK